MRVAHRELLDSMIEPLMLMHSRAEWKHLMSSKGVPVDSVASIEETLALAELVEHPHPSGTGAVKTLPLPFGLDDDPRAATRRAPLLGEHTEEVLGEWLQQPRAPSP